MTIGINGNEANIEHRVGVGQYAFELLRHLQKSTNDVQFTIYLQNNPLKDLPKEKEFWTYKVLPGKGLWTLTALQRDLLKKHPEVFFTPSHYAPIYMPCPSVISVMDMSFERFPEYFKKKDLVQLKYWTKYSAKQAKKIITISEFSKKEICDLYKISPEKIAVTYPGYDKTRFNEKVKKTRSDRYLLFLGTLQPRKNLVRLVDAFNQIKDKEIKLVVVGMINEGRGGWMNQTIFDKVKDLGLEKRVEFAGYLPDEKIPGLMKGAIAYVLPSLYEGFGIPPLEAMAVGTPVVVSKVSSLPEICGHAATYINDPYSIDSIKSALEEVISKGDKKTKIGLEWVKRYNWEETAKKTLEVLQNV